MTAEALRGESLRGECVCVLIIRAVLISSSALPVLQPLLLPMSALVRPKPGESSEDRGQMQGAGGHSSLSPEEEEYFRQYGDMLAAYKGQWTDVDLTGTLEPPRDLFIDVRVLKDAGEIQTEYGYVEFALWFFPFGGHYSEPMADLFFMTG